MSLLALDHVSVTRGSQLVLDAMSLTLCAGELVGLLGPNGAGKTTLMRAAIGLQPARGSIFLGGNPLADLTPRARALAAAYIPQDRSIAWPITIEALVGLGRTPHNTSGQTDRAAIDEALAAMDLDGMRHRPATELSGGERARALTARALAQQAPLLLADEPGAGLDPAHALGLMARLRVLARQSRGVLVSLHDLGLAMRWCDRLILIQYGRLIAEGPPEQVLTPKRLAEVYGITAHLSRDATGPILLPTGLI